MKLLHGKCKEPRKISLHFGSEPPHDSTHEISVWIRDGWGAEEKSVIGDARASGSDSPVIHVFVPKTRAEALARYITTESAARDTLEYKGVPSTPEGIEARQGMETRQTEATNSQRLLVAEVIDAARVYQGGGSERLEDTLPGKVRAAAEASLDRLFYDFRDADDPRWSKVIERARKGADHPLEVLDYNGKTEEHPVCSEVLSFVSHGRKGKEIRSHFSDPPFGWSRDAIDAALISLFRTGHLRATINGTPLKPGQLDQTKMPGADFRIESATIDTQQRISLRKLFQTAKVECNPNEEAEAAVVFLNKLGELAHTAGGEAPLPEYPDTRHLKDLQSLVGNELLVGILKYQAELFDNIKDWTKASELAEQRLTSFNRMRSLARHAQGLNIANKVQPQIEAIETNRSLLVVTDPVPDLINVLVDALRTELVSAEKNYSDIYDQESQNLEAAQTWQKISQSERDRILNVLQIERVSRGATGTEQEVWESVERIPLDGWRTRTAALPQMFKDARIQADKLVEPKTQHVKLASATLSTAEEVKVWTAKTEQGLLEQVRHGPIVVT